MPKSDFRLKNKSYRCYFEITLDLIGGKWKSIILYHIGHNSVLRYADFKKLLPKITERMLSRSLKELEADGIIVRTVFAEVPPRVEYSLTKRGVSLIPLLNALKDWGEDYFNENIDQFDYKALERDL